MHPHVKRLIETNENADKPTNALLLRIDMHRLFDDYQWSVVVSWSILDLCD